MKIRPLIYSKALAGLALAFVASSVARPAHAGLCSALSHPVVVSGSSAVKPFLAALAAKLNQETPPITVIYPNNTGSCDGAGAMATTPAGKVTGTGAVIWDNDGKAIAGGCDFDIDGNVVDIGASDVFASTCSVTVASDVKDFHGPIQTMTFAVPLASTATSISAEAAYLLYGFGAASHPVAPWTDPAYIFQRDASSGTEAMIATAINVPAASWKPAANTNKTSDLVLAALTAAAAGAHADAAIGIMSAAYMDGKRAQLKELAYQHYGQSCGYLPDSTATSFDKANVRDGHYQVWGPLHLYTHTANGKAINADAQKVIDALTMAVDPGFDLVQVEAKNGVIPECAMHVSRTKEIGALSSYQPDESCECKFLKEATGAAPAECKTCDAPGDCPHSRPACNFGFCEVQ